MIRLGSTVLATIVVATVSVAPTAGTVPCRIVIPAEFGAMPGQWLGACRGGQAEGLGVIRAGTAEPFSFFLGEARAGRPLRGLLQTPAGWFAAESFDASGRQRDITSGDPNAYHALYVLAARAATASAQRFAAAGNPASAAYYRRLAKQVTDGEPE